MNTTAKHSDKTTEAQAPLYADVDEVKDFAAELPDRFLECREMGHNWRPHTGKYVDGDSVERTLRCSRCYTKRVQEISLQGVVLRRHYEHPEGYLHVGMGRIVGEGRDALRVESLTRFMTKIAKKTDTAEAAKTAKKTTASKRSTTRSKRKTKAA